MLNDFPETWKLFRNGDLEKVEENLMERLLKFFKEKISMGFTIEDIANNTRLIQHYERVYIWCILEYLYSKEELKFNSNICQFWEYPNLLTIINEKDPLQNDYSIGNLLLGTSYFNNKTGWILFNDYPLMRTLSKEKNNFTKNEISIQTELHKRKLIELLS